MNDTTRPLDKRLFVIEHTEQKTQAALFSGERLVQYFVETSEIRSLVGNIYSGKVRRVVPNMQALFVDIGLSEPALLAARNIQMQSEKNLDERLVGFFEGQKIWVQVCKDAMSTRVGINAKGVRVTTELSFETENLVFLPNSSKISISKKIVDATKRQKLKNSLIEYMRENDIHGGFIIRSLLQKDQNHQWVNDAKKLWLQWLDVKQAQQKATKAGLVYQSPSLIEQLRTVVVTKGVQSLLVVANVAAVFEGLNSQLTVSSDEEIQKQLQQIKFTDQLNTALSDVVEVPDGGTVTFDSTEALTVIDVNMGSAVNSGKNAYEINVQAAQLVIQQLLLRKISGMVIIDFIRMRNNKERNQLFSLIQNLIEEDDSAKTHVHGFTRMGLFELSRERTSLSLRELLSKSMES